MVTVYKAVKYEFMKMKMHFLRVMEYLSVKLSFISLCIVLFQKEF